MKTAELLEATTLPDWVSEEDQAFKTIVARFNFIARQKPLQKPKGKATYAHLSRQTDSTKVNLDEWQFGGDIKDRPEEDELLSKEQRVLGLQKAVARHLFELAQKHRTVSVLEKRAIGWAYFSSVPRFIYPGDTVHHVEALVKDRLFINSHSGGDFDIWFAYRIEPEPPQPEKKEEKPRVLRVVKKASA